MPEWAEVIGGFIRWILKGFRTSLKDEVRGNFDAKWGGTYDFENFIIGIVSVGVILGLLICIIL